MTLPVPSDHLEARAEKYFRHRWPGPGLKAANLNLYVDWLAKFVRQEIKRADAGSDAENDCWRVLQPKWKLVLHDISQRVADWVRYGR